MIEFCTASVFTAEESHWGAQTASMVRLRDSALVAAHKTAKLLSKIKVTNLRDGRSVILMVIDRGPYRRGRCVDVTPAANRALGLGGLGKVKVEPLED